jgi:hypothetical protein
LSPDPLVLDPAERQSPDLTEARIRAAMGDWRAPAMSPPGYQNVSEKLMPAKGRGAMANARTGRPASHRSSTAKSRSALHIVRGLAATHMILAALHLAVITAPAVSQNTPWISAIRRSRDC